MPSLKMLNHKSSERVIPGVTQAAAMAITQNREYIKLMKSLANQHRFSTKIVFLVMYTTAVQEFYCRMIPEGRKRGPGIIYVLRASARCSRFK